MPEAVDNSADQIDKEALKRKYREVRDKRLRSEGNEQYIEIKNRLAHYLEDPYVPQDADQAYRSSGQINTL
jgi:cyclohexanone monooxygenase